MRSVFSAIILLLAVLGLYPLLAIVSVVMDLLIGDGNASHYLLSSTELRLSISEIRQDWLNSLPVSIGIMGLLLVLALITEHLASSFAAKFLLLSFSLLAAFAAGFYVGESVWNGLVYLCCALPLIWASYIAVQSPRERNPHA